MQRNPGAEWTLTGGIQRCKQCLPKAVGEMGIQGNFQNCQDKLIPKLSLVDQELTEILTVKEKASIFELFNKSV